MFEAIEQQELKKNKELDEKKNINLLPEELKRKEVKELKKAFAQKSEKVKEPLTAGQIAKKEPANFFGSLRNKLQGLFRKDFVVVKPQSEAKNKVPAVKENKLDNKPLIKIKDSQSEPIVSNIKPDVRNIPKNKPKLPDLKEDKKGLEVNLLPAAEEERISKRKRLRVLTYALISEAAILVFASIALLFWANSETNKTNSLKDEKSRLTIALKKSAADKKNSVLFKNKITELENLLLNREQWTLFLKFLEDNTVPTVYYESLDFRDDGTVNLMGKAADIRAVSEQIVAFQSAGPLIKQVVIGGINFSKVEQQQEEETEQSFIGFSVQLLIDKNRLSLQKDGKK